MDTVAIQISAADSLQEILVAEMSALSIEGFEQQDHHLRLFFQREHWTREARTVVRDILARYGLSEHWNETLIPARNWNLEWEKSIQPLSVPPFYIRPSWAEPLVDHMQLIELVIDPQMSFGTGHHESTRLALQHLGVCLDNLDRVLDVGTGTGILAIAAAKLGAQSVLGLDFDTWSFKNASENIVLNQVAGMVEIRQGTIESVGETGFTLILANINRTVLRNDLPSYVERAAPKAEIILSGLQLTDKALIAARLKKNNLLLLEERIEANWWSVRARCPKS